MPSRYDQWTWYPPAETKIPVADILKAFIKPGSTVESKLRILTGAGYCTFGPSGKALLCALLSKLREQCDGSRDEVLIPGYTCYSVAAAVAKAGLKIKCYDIDFKTFLPVASSLRQRASHRTLAIISQHLLGIPVNVTLAGETAGESGAYHIEDAAQGFGGLFDNHALGMQGDFGLYSFGRGKSLPVGGGGALISHRYKTGDLLGAFRKSLGFSKLCISAITQLMAQPQFYWIAERLPLGLGRTVFDPNFKIGNLPVVFENMTVKLAEKVSDSINHRRKIATIYKANLPQELLMDEDNRGEPVYTRFPVLCPLNEVPAVLYRYGVRRLYPQAISRQAQIRPYLAKGENTTPGAVKLSRFLFTLPTHSGINPVTARVISRQLIHAVSVDAHGQHL